MRVHEALHAAVDGHIHRDDLRNNGCTHAAMNPETGCLTWVRKASDEFSQEVSGVNLDKMDWNPVMPKPLTEAEGLLENLRGHGIDSDIEKGLEFLLKKSVDAEK